MCLFFNIKRYGENDLLSKTNINHECVLTNHWNGPSETGGAEHQAFEELMKECTFALCPRGCGHDSARFFEACFFQRIPIVIGDNILFGQLDGIDLSFCYRIS